MKRFLTLFLAHGLGVGKIPLAPGTFGSILGLAWMELLLWPGHYWLFCAGILAAIFFCISVCSQAEKYLNIKDPGSVVLDEVVAIPICFLPWITHVYFESGEILRLEQMFSRENWPLALSIFVMFRILDVVKPWPISNSQHLRGGWGVTIDDLLAAGYVALFLEGLQLVKEMVLASS
jgi:phosphatidylglycerophosphatase A